MLFIPPSNDAMEAKAAEDSEARAELFAFYRRAAAVSGLLSGVLLGVVLFTVLPHRAVLAVRFHELKASFVSGLMSAGNRQSFSISELERTVLQASHYYRLEPELVWAVIAVESNFKADARSPKGAQGYMQLMPATARSMGVKDLNNPRENVYGGARYLRQLLDRYQNDRRLALAAYNAGPGAVARFGGVPPYRETRNYVKRVLQVYEFEKSKRMAAVN